MGPDPGKTAIADGDLGNAVHPRPQRLGRFLEACLDQEKIASVGLAGYRRNTIDRERQRLAGQAPQRQLVGLARPRRAPPDPLCP